MIAPWFFPKRALYYWAKVYQQQLEEGHDYHELRHTISISFVDSVLFRRVETLHHQFGVVDSRTQLVLTDDLSIHVVELPKFDLGPNQLSTPFDIWCYFLRHGETLDTTNLPTALDKPIIHRALGVLNMLTQNEQERERYEARLKGRRDESSYQADLARVEMRGELIGSIRAYQKALNEPQSPKEELMAMSPEELLRLADQLETRIVRPSA